MKLKGLHNKDEGNLETTDAEIDIKNNFASSDVKNTSYIMEQYLEDDKQINITGENAELEHNLNGEKTVDRND